MGMTSDKVKLALYKTAQMAMPDLRIAPDVRPKDRGPHDERVGVVVPKGVTPLPQARPRYDAPRAGIPARRPSGMPPTVPRSSDWNSGKMTMPVHSPVGPSSQRSFSGADIRCVVHVLGNGGMTVPVLLADVQTLSYSTHRDKFPVRALGHTYPRGYTRGGRTIAGSMVFTMFDREVLWRIIQNYKYDTEMNEGEVDFSSYSPMLDQIPPFDITITFANEYGDVANMALYGVEIVDEGTVLSIDDIMVEKTCSFVARDLDIVRPYAEAPSWRALGTEVTNKHVTQEDVNVFMETLERRRAAINRTDYTSNDSVWAHDIPYDYAMFSSTMTHAAKHVVITTGMSCIHTTHGMSWIGTVKQLGDREYTFIPSPKSYPVLKPPENYYRVHSSFVDRYRTMELAAEGARDDATSEYLIPSVGKTAFETELVPY